MADQKRFQAQNLDSEDYAKTEYGAKAVKEGGRILFALSLVVLTLKNNGPSFIKNALNIIRK